MEPFMALPISLPQRGSRLLLRDLHRQLRAAITNGRLRAGARLPSTRTLAAACGVSRNTAVAAYELLLSEGYVAARRGSGTRVADSLPLPPRAKGTAGAPGDDRRLNRVWRGRALPRMNQAAVLPFSFQIGIPDPRSFPAEVWRRLSGRTLRTVRLQPAYRDKRRCAGRSRGMSRTRAPYPVQRMTSSSPRARSRRSICWRASW